MKRYLHLSFNFSDKTRMDKVQSILNSHSEDWLKYNGNCWIVWTSLNGPQLYNELSKVLTTSENVFIIEPKPGVFGYMPQWIWDWANKKRT